MPARARSRRPLVLPLLLGWLAAASAACVSVPPPAPYSPPERSAPDWHDAPLTWEKLQRIEIWLDGQGARDWPDEVPLAELELAEGRALFAANAPDERTRRLRADAAGAGFRRVLANPRSSTFERRRARQGLADLEVVETPAAAPARLAVQSRASWNAAAAVPGRLTRHRGGWTRITVHHSAQTTAAQLGRGTRGDVADALRRVQRYHIGNNGWGDIAYHYLIDPDGRVFTGRSLEFQGAHASGKNNVANIGICLFGHFDEERPSEAALASLEALVDRLRDEHSIGRSRVYGHLELKATECPGRWLMPWIERYRSGARPVAASAEWPGSRTAPRRLSGEPGRIR